MSLYLSFINLINFSHQNGLFLQQNWLCIKRKNIFHQQRPSNNAYLAWLIVITTLSLVRNVIWREKYSIEASCQCAKIAQSFQRNIRSLFPLGFLCFYSSLNVFNLSATTNNLRTNDTFFIKPKCVLLIGEIRTQRQIFEVDFDYIR